MFSYWLRVLLPLFAVLSLPASTKAQATGDRPAPVPILSLYSPNSLSLGFDKALDTYIKLCVTGGTKSVLNIFKDAGLRSPFDPAM